jgi:diaminopropionate ammonia-lyase
VTTVEAGAVVVNQRARRYRATDDTIDSRSFHRRFGAAVPTPLVSAPTLAERTGVGEVWVKVEAERLGLPSFKILGASWAIYRLVTRLLGEEPRAWSSPAELAARVATLRPRTLVAPTDGNHGRAVAHVARLLGFDARIYVPDNTVPARIAGIESERAEVVVVPGTYDDTVDAAAAEEGRDRVHVVSDTAWPGYSEVPRDVVEGYTTIFDELGEQLAARPSLVVAPVGVGALAAATVRYAHRRASERGTRTAVLGVEPTRAACVLESLRTGHPVVLEGGQDSVMAGLNCGTPSAIAWPDLLAGLDAVIAVDDAAAEAAMRSFATIGVVAGESGAASLAGLEALVRDADARAGLGLGPDAVVVLLSTEGATDPVAYERVVGRAAADVAAGAPLGREADPGA